MVTIVGKGMIGRRHFISRSVFEVRRAISSQDYPNENLSYDYKLPVDLHWGDEDTYPITFSSTGYSLINPLKFDYEAIIIGVSSSIQDHWNPELIKQRSIIFVNDVHAAALVRAAEVKNAAEKCATDIAAKTSQLKTGNVQDKWMAFAEKLPAYQTKIANFLQSIQDFVTKRLSGKKDC